MSKEKDTEQIVDEVVVVEETAVVEATKEIVDETKEVESTDEVEEAGESDSEESSDEDSEEPKDLAVKALYDKAEKVAVASTDVVDRHGERINQEGWDLKNFKSNPVMLWAHDHKEIAVGKCTNVHIERKGGTPRLVFTPEFHDKTETSRSLKALYEDGWLNSFSVGFIPKDFDGKDSMYLKQELLEISAVNVPANPDARMMAYKSLVEQGIKKSVAKKVTEADQEEIKAQEEAEARLKAKETYFGDYMKTRGAVADELAEDAVMGEKSKMMKDVYSIWWAFCDVFWDEETPIEDFSTLLNETISLLSKVAGGTYSAPEESDEMDDEKVEESVVIDNIKDSGNDLDKLNVEVESMVKTQENKDTSVAPDQEARAKQTLIKGIAKASDMILADAKKNPVSKQTVDLTKVIKRAAEILITAQKGNK